MSHRRCNEIQPQQHLGSNPLYMYLPCHVSIHTRKTCPRTTLSWKTFTELAPSHQHLLHFSSTAPPILLGALWGSSNLVFVGGKTEEKTEATFTYQRPVADLGKKKLSTFLGFWLLLRLQREIVGLRAWILLLITAEEEGVQQATTKCDTCWGHPNWQQFSERRHKQITNTYWEKEGGLWKIFYQSEFDVSSKTRKIVQVPCYVESMEEKCSIKGFVIFSLVALFLPLHFPRRKKRTGGKLVFVPFLLLPYLQYRVANLLQIYVTYKESQWSWSLSDRSNRTYTFSCFIIPICPTDPGYMNTYAFISSFWEICIEPKFRIVHVPP